MRHNGRVLAVVAAALVTTTGSSVYAHDVIVFWGGTTRVALKRHSPTRLQVTHGGYVHTRFTVDIGIR